jgi:hypothetical protein
VPFGFDDAALALSAANSANNLFGGLFGGKKKGGPDLKAQAVNAAATQATGSISGDIRAYLAQEASLAEQLLISGYEPDAVIDQLLDQRQLLWTQAISEAQRQRAVAWGAGAYQALERLAHQLGAGDADGLTQYPGRDSEPVAPLPSLVTSGGSSAGSSLAIPVSLLSPSRPMIRPPLPGRELPGGPATLDAAKGVLKKAAEAVTNNPVLFLALGVAFGLTLAVVLRR